MEHISMSGLNAAQLEAVEYDPRVPLQILAGPGSGKTKVLTTRIAHLILRCGIPPASICAVTFTKKAANEMKHRLITLIGKESATRVRMGTFHALCALFLRNYARLVGLETNFTICDADESKKMISNFRKKYHGHSESGFLKEGTILSSISKAKAKGLSADDLVAKASNSTAHTQELDRIVAEIYHDYESALRSSNCLDFDDLLLFGVRLFTQQPHTADWCNHVLVDEFQDTNSVQYELMKAIAVKQCVTIVGDPDQSIYGWRSAEVGNLARMRRDFPSTQQVLLEENYRSTGGILKASIAIVAQDSARVQKSLRTSHPIGKTPVLCSFPSEQEEAEFCATEIARVVALMGGMLKCGDFAVLLRFNALSRSIEAALQKAGIPSRVLGGHKFFERLEIKDLSAYLQLVDNPDFSPALTRIINVPPRAIGAKTLSELAARGAKTNKSQLAVVEGICDSRLPDISPPVKRKLVSFVKTMRTLRDKAAQGSSPADLLKCLLTSIDYEAHLRKTQPDWESRWENVQELVSFAADDRGNEPSSPSDESTENDTPLRPLRRFLEASMLSSEDDNNREDSDEKVTISTVHAAKGLEWPVVIVPAVEQGTFPFYRTEDKAEERRLLYVACTRAQGLLYLSHAAKRRVAGETKTRDISEFMSALLKENSILFSARPPVISAADRRVVAQVLGRPEPDESEVTKRMTAYNMRISRRHGTENQIPAPTKWISPSVLPPDRSQQPLRHVDASASGATTDAPNQGPSMPRPASTLLSRRERLQTSQAPSTSAQTSSVHDYPLETSTAPVIGTKRRLGMGRVTGGYSNKKFKPPTVP